MGFRLLTVFLGHFYEIGKFMVKFFLKDATEKDKKINEQTKLSINITANCLH